MKRPKIADGRKRAPKRAPAQDTARLDEMIGEATVDCNDDSEQAQGLFNMLEEYLILPFTTTVLGVDVVVENIGINDADEIVAVCRRGRERQRVGIGDLPLPDPRPAGAEWIDAYRRWARWR